MDRAVGTDDRRRAEAVDGEPVLAPHPALPASEGEAADARLGHDAAGHDEAERLRFAVDVSPDRAALDRGSPGHRVDGHGPHPREVDDDAAVAARQTGHGVPAAPHRDQQVPLAGEVDRVDHVGGAGRSDLERRAPVVHGVVDRIGVIAVVGRCEHVAPEAGAQLLELVVFDLGLATSSVETKIVIAYPALRPAPGVGKSAAVGHCVARRCLRPWVLPIARNMRVAVLRNIRKECTPISWHHALFRVEPPRTSRRLGSRRLALPAPAAVTMNRCRANVRVMVAALRVGTRGDDRSRQRTGSK